MTSIHQPTVLVSQDPSTSYPAHTLHTRADPEIFQRGLRKAGPGGVGGGRGGKHFENLLIASSFFFGSATPIIPPLDKQYLRLSFFRCNLVGASCSEVIIFVTLNPSPLQYIFCFVSSLLATATPLLQKSEYLHCVVILLRYPRTFS